MLRKALLVSALAAFLLIAAGSAVYAQGGGDKFVLGENFVLRSGEVLTGNLAVLGGNATLERGSSVQGDVAVAGGQLTVAGTIHGSAAVLGGTAVLADTAVIEGDFASFGGTVETAPGAVIQGETFDGLRFAAPPGEAPALPPLPEVPVPALRPRLFGGFGELISWQFATLGSALMMLLLGIIAVLVAPKPLSRIAAAATTQPALSFGAGLLTFIVGILAGALLLIACCLGLFVWLALMIAIAIGWIAVGLWVGQRLLAALKVRDASMLAEVALGVFLITVLGRLPFCLGALFSAVVGSIGLGAVVLTRFGRQPVLSDGDRSGAPQTQSLADLDAEVLAPLALPSVGVAVVAPAPTAPVEASEADVPETPPAQESESDPISGPADGAQSIVEPPVTPTGAPQEPGDEGPEADKSEDEASQHRPDQPPV